MQTERPLSSVAPPKRAACRTGETSQQHPLDAGFLQLIQQYREDGPPADNTARSVLRFTHGAAAGAGGAEVAEPGHYFFDFATRARLEGPVPEAALITPVPRVDLPRYRCAA